MKSTVVDPSTVGTQAKVKYQLNNGYTFVLPSWTEKLIGVQAFILMQYETSNEVISVKIEVQSNDATMPLHESFMTDPFEPKQMRPRIVLDSFREMPYKLRPGAHFDFYGMTLQNYTIPPQVGMQIFYE